MSSPVLITMPATAFKDLEKYWSTKVRCMLMSRKMMPYMLSLSIMSRPSSAPMAAISGMQSPEA